MTSGSLFRCYLTFDRRGEKANSFVWVAETESLRCRIQVASAPEVIDVDVRLRFRGRGKARGLVHCRPIDETTFELEAANVHEDLPRLAIVLMNVPEDVAVQIRRL